MAYDPERIINMGELEKRGKTVRFGIKEKDRSRHIYVIGQTGTGKSTLLEMLAMQDIYNGTGLIFLDPHGQSVDNLLRYVKKDRIDDVIYFAPHLQERPIGLNIMEDIGYDRRHLVVSSLMASFEKIWGASTWSDRMAYILSNTLLALIEYPGTTLLDVGRMYTSKDFRKKVVENLKDPQVKKYWVEEFEGYTDRYAQEATPSIQNKIGQFTSNPLMRNIIGQKKSAFDFRKIMDEGKMLLVNLSKGQIGENNARMLGVLFTTKIYLAALSRSDMKKSELEQSNSCNFYVDEFQSFANSSFSDILSEARKYKLNLVLAHQYLGQLYTDDTGGGNAIRDAVFGNVGTFISFRVGPVDAEIISKQFAPEVTEEDLVALPRYHVYLTLNIDGAGSTPFSARTFYEPAPDGESLEDEVIKRTMETYGVDREAVEEVVRKNLEEDEKAKQASAKGAGGTAKNQQGKNQHAQDKKGQKMGTPLKGLVEHIQKQSLSKDQTEKAQSNTKKGVGGGEKKQRVGNQDKRVAAQSGSSGDPPVKESKKLFGKLFSKDARAEDELSVVDAAGDVGTQSGEVEKVGRRSQKKETASAAEGATKDQGDQRGLMRHQKHVGEVKEEEGVVRGQGSGGKKSKEREEQKNNLGVRQGKKDQRKGRGDRDYSVRKKEGQEQEVSRGHRQSVSQEVKPSDQKHDGSHKGKEVRRPDVKKERVQRTYSEQDFTAVRLKRRDVSRVKKDEDQGKKETSKDERHDVLDQQNLSGQKQLTDTVSQQKQQPGAVPQSGGLGDLIQHAKSGSFQKDLKVTPKKEKKAPPINYEEGWVAIGDLNKTKQDI